MERLTLVTNHEVLCQRALMELDEAVVVVRDAAGRIIACSRGAAHVAGVPAHRLLGRTESPFADGDPVTRIPVNGGNGIPIGSIELMTPADFRASSTPAGAVEAALLASESRLRRLMEANVIGVGIVNHEGRWLEANDELLRIMGRSRQELVAGQIDGEVIAPAFVASQLAARSAAARDGAQRPGPAEFCRPDGRTVPVLIGYATVSGVQEHFVASVLDLSAQRQVEDALRDADRRKDEFLAMLAHELRNPLAPMVTALHLMERPEAAPGLVTRARATLGRQMTTLIRLVDDLLDVSRLVRGSIELRLERTSVQTIVQRALEMSQPLLQAHGHTIDVILPPQAVMLLADPVRMAQVVGNLLNNAAKYTPSGGHIALTVTRTAQGVSIAVRDTGLGIPADQLGRVFDLFTQVDPTLDRARGGLGVGLTVVKRLVEMHEGTVRAESEGPGRGSTFTVSLPVVDGDDAIGTGRQERPEAVRPLRVLIVDDNVDAADTLAAFLQLEGHDVQAVHDSATALARSASGFDVAILDIGLPIMDGYELARRLRTQLGDAAPILIALTGYGQRRDREYSAAAGFSHHLLKPVDARTLKDVLARIASS